MKELNGVYYANNHLVKVIEKTISTITIPSNVTDINDYAFEDCNSLTTVVNNSSTPQRFSRGFSNYTTATLYIPQGTKEAYASTEPWKYFKNIVEMEESDGLRYAGNHLIDVTDKTMTTITIPEGVTDIGAYALAECQNLSSVIVPGTVTSIGEYAFEGCSGLPYVVFPLDAALKNVKDYAFANMDSLISWDFPEQVVSIGNHVFENDVLLESVTFPSTVTHIGEYVFANCPKLKAVALGMRTPIDIEENVFMEETYATCTLFVPRGTKEAYRAAAPWSKFRHIEEFDYEFAAEIFLVEGSEKKIVKCFNKQVSSYTVPSGTTSIGGGAFAGCSNLKTVAFASSVSSIGAGAFAHCRLLSSITLSSTLTIIEPYAFYGCLMLGEVKIGARIPPQIDETVFEGCYRNCILYVPRGSKEAYASTHPWSLFYRIEEYDPEPDAIEAIESDGATVIDRYTMNGQRITSPLKGVNLLRMSDGTVRKVLVK